MKHIWVRYKDGLEDIVPHKMLNDLLAQDALEYFYRPSESRWIDPGSDNIRTMESGAPPSEEFFERRRYQANYESSR